VGNAALNIWEIKQLLKIGKAAINNWESRNKYFGNRAINNLGNRVTLNNR